MPDVTDNINYFDSPDIKLIANHITREERQDFSVRREILWESQSASQKEVNEKEKEFILKFNSNDPKKGTTDLPCIKAEV